MSLKIFKRRFKDGNLSETWWVRGTVAGHKIFRSAKSTDRRQAEQFAFELEKDGREYLANSETRYFSEAIAEYAKRGKDLQYLETILNKLGMLPINEVNQSAVDAAASETFRNHKQATINRWFYTPVCSILNMANRLGWCQRPAIKKPRAAQTPPAWVEIDWLEKLWAASNDKVMALTTFLPYTGCRIGEALSLTWESVNLDDGWAYIPKTKTNQHRTVYLPAPVKASLRTLRNALGKAPATGKVFAFKDRHAAVLEVRRACKRAGIPYHRPHVIGSHTYATWMRRDGGADTIGLMATGRWKDARSVARYAHVVPHAEAKKADLLPVSKKKKSAKSVHKPKKPNKSTKLQP